MSPLPITSLRGKSLALAAGLCLLAAPARSEGFGFEGKGTAAGQFLKLGAGARAAAMGEAYTAVADEATAVYWNPAALTQVPARSITMMHAEYVSQVFYDYAGFAIKHKHAPIGWGVGVQYLNAGSILETDQNGDEIGYFRPNDTAVLFGIGYGKSKNEHDDAKGFAVGATAKYIRSKIRMTAETAAFDLGALSPEYFDGRIRLAAAAQNLSGRVKYIRDSDRLPVAYKLGLKLRPHPFWIVSLEGVYPNDTQAYGCAGTEAEFQILDSVRVALRAGFSSKSIEDSDGFYGLSGGAGIKLLALHMDDAHLYKSPDFREHMSVRAYLSFDYAFTPMGRLGELHRASMSLHF